MLQDAEDNYYITANYLLELANRAYDLFVSSEVEERRQLMKLVLQNPKVEGKKVQFQLQKPFDTILNYNDNQLGLKTWDSYRRIDWINEIEYPELTYQETQKFLSARFASV